MVMTQALKLSSVENGYVKNSSDIRDSKFSEVLVCGMRICLNY